MERNPIWRVFATRMEQAWSAPEVLDDDGPASASASAAVTSRADVFAYGLTVWEMLSLCLPHAEHLDCSDDDDDVVDDEPDSEEVATGLSVAVFSTYITLYLILLGFSGLY